MFNILWGFLNKFTDFRSDVLISSNNEFKDRTVLRIFVVMSLKWTLSWNGLKYRNGNKPSFIWFTGQLYAKNQSNQNKRFKRLTPKHKKINEHLLHGILISSNIILYRPITYSLCVQIELYIFKYTFRGKVDFWNVIVIQQHTRVLKHLSWVNICNRTVEYVVRQYWILQTRGHPCALLGWRPRSLTLVTGRIRRTRPPASALVSVCLSMLIFKVHTLLIRINII